MKTETFGSATLYLGDCLEVMQDMSDRTFGLAITDPPYFDGPNCSGYYGKGVSSLGVTRAKHYDHIADWAVPEAQYFTELQRVAKHQIIWGANHFADRFNAASPSWIVWDKLNGASTFADAELAYCSMPCAVRVFRYVWNGMHQGQYGGNKRLNEARIHPTQSRWRFTSGCWTPMPTLASTFWTRILAAGLAPLPPSAEALNLLGSKKTRWFLRRPAGASSAGQSSPVYFFQHREKRCNSIWRLHANQLALIPLRPYRRGHRACARHNHPRGSVRMTRKTIWPAALITAIRAELAGNAQRDLLGWAHRVTAANKVPADVSRARLILDIKKENSQR